MGVASCMPADHRPRCVVGAVLIHEGWHVAYGERCTRGMYLMDRVLRTNLTGRTSLTGPTHRKGPAQRVHRSGLADHPVLCSKKSVV